MNRHVPSADVAGQWAPLRAAVLERVARVLDHGRFVDGPEVGEFEDGLATVAGVPHAVACSSGTTALILALLALGLRPGDEVIVPGFAFASPVEAVLLMGATPVLADVDPRTYTLDSASVAAAITEQTRAVIAVSLYGHPADFDALEQVCHPRGVRLVDDAAQSFGASVAGRPTGSLADLTCTSFFPTKPLGGVGEGGAVLTADASLARRVREARDHGQSAKYVHTALGLNGRLDSISCAALTVALPYLGSYVTRRRELARSYSGALSDTGLMLPVTAPEVESAWAQYTVQVSSRDHVAATLQAAGIGVATHYPTPLHQQPAYLGRVRSGDLAVSESLSRRVLSLPLYPTLSELDQERVVSAVRQA